MANVLILGGGFGGVVAAETLVTNLRDEHQVTLVSCDALYFIRRSCGWPSANVTLLTSRSIYAKR